MIARLLAWLPRGNVLNLIVVPAGSSASPAGLNRKAPR